MHRISIRFILLFTCLFGLTVPLEYHFLPDVGYYTSYFFEPLIKWVGDHVFKLEEGYTAHILSDSTGIYTHAFIIAIFSMLCAIIWSLADKEEKNFGRIWYMFRVAASYYLALQLFRYGFDKVFKGQFYFPEPNTLYTPMGHLSPDILYWSTIGSSYTYSVFAGILEIVPAILLLFKRTRIIGAMIAVGVMINVVMINFGFDISVKVFSLFLLLISLIIAWPGFRKLVQLYIKKEVVSEETQPPVMDTKGKRLAYVGIKLLVIGLIVFESVYMYAQSGIFNDDKAPRPYLHGAYEVMPDNNSGIIKRVFVHRRGYFIFQFVNDEMQDFKLDYDLVNEQLIMTDYDDSVLKFDFTYSEKDSVLTLTGAINGRQTELKAKKLDLSKLPIHDNDFHWTIDSYN